MQQLEESALIFGRMMWVREAHLIARYNQALQGFDLRQTKLKAFRIDMVGYSPEIAEELGDRQYLDPHHVNRRFIILSPQQFELPVVNSAFSNTGALMHGFFERNQRSLNALTIKDVIYGEIEDSILQAHDIEDLLSIEEVTFKVFTGDDLPQQAYELRGLIDRLMQEEKAWRDDDMLHRMVELAQSTGDIRNNDLVPDAVVFRHNTFWVDLFGGVYVFIDERQTTVIGDASAPGFRRSRPWQVSYIDRKDKELVYRFLVETGRVDIPRGSWIERSGYLEHRMEMLMTLLAFHETPKGKHKPYSKKWRKTWMNAHADLVEEEGTLPFLLWAQKQYEAWESVDLDEIDPRGRFLLSRAKPGHEDQWLVNRLISEYVPFDFIARFVFNKPQFYADYEKWSPNLKEYVVETVAKTYLKDKKKLRSKLYASEQ